MNSLQIYSTRLVFNSLKLILPFVKTDTEVHILPNLIVVR